jgi:asparagine synthase (glutamine-hydrolysing)
MCGITGVFNVDGRPVPVPLLKEMADVVTHRGPDSEGYWADSFIGFGHRRLAILDLSPLGHQPMVSDDGRYILVYNGEVYNFQDLRLQLESQGYSFRSDCDTEVVLKSFQHWGTEAVLKFNGMFAFAIWDKKENCLTLARDRFGIKPLYYYFKNNTFLFGSEIKSILKHPKVEVDVSIEALNEYFSFQNIFSDLTLFEGIRLLPAGHYLQIQLASHLSDDISQLKAVQYWDYDFKDHDSYGTEEEYIEELDRLFQQAVNRQLVSDVEVGAYLSGGMDSGAITSLAAKTFKHLKSFTCGFDLSSASGLELSFDERKKAEYLSNLYKTEHYEVILKAGDMERVMEDLIWSIEDPRVGQSYPNYYVSRLASRFVKVCLSGAGGDELFAGYPWRYYRAVNNDDFDSYSEKYYRYWQRLIPDRFKPQFYQPDIYPKIWDYQCKDVFRSVMERKPVLGELTPEEYVNRSLYFEAKTFMHGLLLVEDKLSMASSLETRVPFLDNDLVDFAMSVPVKYKLKDLSEVVRINENEPGLKTKKYFAKTQDGKIVLRKMLNRYVPTEYANGIKQGFSAPDASWFKGESIDYIKDLLYNKRARIYDYIQPGFAKSLLDEHLQGKENRRLLIWSLLNFEWWLKVFVK